MTEQSLISEQLKELRLIAEEYRKPPNGREVRGTAEALCKAADTIEDLYAKLQAANVERSMLCCENDVFSKIISELDKRIGTQLKIIANLGNEPICRHGYLKSLEAYQQSKLIVEQNIEEYKQ